MNELNGLSGAAKRRLSFIDFHLMFLGSINRQHLIDRFGIKSAAATRDISLYRRCAEGNAVYDNQKMVYFSSEKFKPLFERSSSQVVSALIQGLGDDAISDSASLIQGETLPDLTVIDLDTLALITQAIALVKALTITYISLSSGEKERVISPIAIVNNNSRWHVRAFDRTSGEFRDFVIGRIVSIKRNDSIVESYEKAANDLQWNKKIELKLCPHPTLKHPEVIIHEYRMINNEISVSVRAHLVGYFLRRWNIDCSPNNSLNSNVYQLALINKEILTETGTGALAPGYK